MDLSIITVTWNVKDLVRENFKVIRANTGNLDYEIFAIDNASKDGTAAMIETEFPEVKLIANDHNAGFAKANNQGIAQSQGRYVLLLNPDNRVLPGALEKMAAWMDAHPEAGVAGCHLIREDNSTVMHVRRFPTVCDQLAIVLKLPHLWPAILDAYLYADFDYTQEAVVDSIRGSFFMIRREVIDKLGGLDERYFIWFEEVDFCRQVKAAGWNVMYTPVAECIDYVGKSFTQVKRGITQQYFRDSMIKYFQKWQPAWQCWLLRAAWPIGSFIAWAGETVNIKSKAKT